MKNNEKPVKKDRKKNKEGVNMKFLKFFITAAVMIACLVVSPSLAFGQTSLASDNKSAVTVSNVTTSGDWGDRHPVRLKGAGTLKAEGNGAVRIKGRTDKTSDGTVRISGNGVLIINDLEGDLDLIISGYGGKVELKKDVWLYYGFSGNAEIKGSGFTVNIIGSNLEAYARGQAIVFLTGEGSYTVERNIAPEA